MERNRETKAAQAAPSEQQLEIMIEMEEMEEGNSGTGGDDMQMRMQMSDIPMRDRLSDEERKRVEGWIHAHNEAAERERVGHVGK